MNLVAVLLNGLRTFIGFLVLVAVSTYMNILCIQATAKPIFSSWYFFLIFVVFVGGKVADKIFAKGVPASVLDVIHKASDAEVAPK